MCSVVVRSAWMAPLIASEDIIKCGWSRAVGRRVVAPEHVHNRGDGIGVNIRARKDIRSRLETKEEAVRTIGSRTGMGVRLVVAKG